MGIRDVCRLPFSLTHSAHLSPWDQLLVLPPFNLSTPSPVHACMCTRTDILPPETLSGVWLYYGGSHWTNFTKCIKLWDCWCVHTRTHTSARTHSVCLTVHNCKLLLASSSCWDFTWLYHYVLHRTFNYLTNDLLNQCLISPLVIPIFD